MARSSRFLTSLLKQAVLAVVAFPLRSFFCIAGISLGVVSITLIIASIDGANEKAESMLRDFGPDSMIIFGGNPQQQSSRSRNKTITLADMAMLQQVGGCYETVAMASIGRQTASNGANKWQTMVVGSGPEYFGSWGWHIATGQAFTEMDVAEFNMVGVIGWEVFTNLFPGAKPEEVLGRFILVGGRSIMVLGVLKSRGAGHGGMSLDDRIVMPMSTVMKKYLNESRYVSAIRARFHGDLAERVKDVTALLRQGHGLQDSSPDDFSIRTADDARKFLLVIQGSLLLFLGSAGGIALIVSGFVMANLFLISVSERKHEIGVRRAFGARKAHIIIQFLAETVLISLLGCLFGLLLGIGAAKILSLTTSIPVLISPKIFLITASVSITVGVLAGLYPARRAAQMDPLEALRSL